MKLTTINKSDDGVSHVLERTLRGADIAYVFLIWPRARAATTEQHIHSVVDIQEPHESGPLLTNQVGRKSCILVIKAKGCPVRAIVPSHPCPCQPPQWCLPVNRYQAPCAPHYHLSHSHLFQHPCLLPPHPLHHCHTMHILPLNHFVSLSITKPIPSIMPALLGFLLRSESKTARINPNS
jgi:hypothetical protein